MRHLHAIAAAATLSLLGCNSGAETGGGNAPRALPPAPVIIALAQARDFVETIEAIGTTRARESVTLTARVTGHVQEVLFDEGSRVEAGQLLLRLDDEEERADLAAAEAAHEQARSRYQRQQELARQGLVSKDLLDEQSETLKSTAARRDLARARLDQRRIRAPFSGVLGMRQVSPGALVTPGTALVTLDDVSTMRVDFSVAETQIRHIAAAQRLVALAAAWPGRTFEGAVVMVGSRVDPITRAVPVQASFDNPDGALKPGMLLTLKVDSTPRATLFVPEAALAPEQAQQYVWRLQGDDAVERVPVRIGARLPGQVEIVEGLSAGDRVVVEGTANLRGGRPVRIVGHHDDIAGA